VDDRVDATPGVGRWAALGGVVYVVLFVVGNLLMFAGTPSGDDAPAKVRAFYSDSGHRDRIGIGWVVAGLGIFAFLWFLAALRDAVRRTDGGGALTALTTIGGAIYAALALAAVALDSAVRTMSDDTYRHRVFPEVIHAADDAGYVIHATGGAGLAAMLTASSLGLMRARIWPRWVGWFGIVAAIAALASIFFLPILLWLLFIAVASLLLYARGDAGSRDAVGASASR
jgi:hypothetical protein